MGARVLTGGRSFTGQGYFYEPTVITDVTPGMPVFYEETFGPVAAIVRAPDERQAIELANRSQYGLSCNLWTRNIEKARSMAAQIETGSCFINGMTTSDPRLPFGGIKQSGFGRELSVFGIREFVNIQTIWIGPRQETVPVRTTGK
jgi:succinate-semialdehyde dehydrogenase/glutarate-semialdehyde dehydrogenase